MTRKELYLTLNYVDHSRKTRMQMATQVLNNPAIIEPLLSIAFEDKDIISSRACWVIEYTAKKNLSFIFAYLDTFTSKLGSVHLDSSVRPVSKICEVLMKAYFLKKDPKILKTLTEQHLKHITAACFDWLIGDHKVAAQAYSMTSLLLLGRKFEWILPELKMVLEQNYSTGSAAYKARARMTLAKIK